MSSELAMCGICGEMARRRRLFELVIVAPEAAGASEQRVLGHPRCIAECLSPKVVLGPALYDAIADFSDILLQVAETRRPLWEAAVEAANLEPWLDPALLRDILGDQTLDLLRDERLVLVWAPVGDDGLLATPLDGSRVLTALDDAHAWRPPALGHPSLRLRSLDPLSADPIAPAASLAEAAYTAMYDAASAPLAKTFYEDAVAHLTRAIEAARQLKRLWDVERLESRLAHVRAVYDSQFRGG